MQMLYQLSIHTFNFKCMFYIQATLQNKNLCAMLLNKIDKEMCCNTIRTNSKIKDLLVGMARCWKLSRNLAGLRHNHLVRLVVMYGGKVWYESERFKA